MNAKRTVLGFLGIIFISVFCFADYLELSRKANLYSKPDRTSIVLKSFESGEKLLLPSKVDQVNGFYPAIDPASTQQGWIYRTYVRRYKGLPEGEKATVEAAETTTTAVSSVPSEDSSRHIKIGKPQATYERFREGYVLAEDARLKIPLWVQYELTPDDLKNKVDRNTDFQPDTSIPFGSRAERSDYSKSGFDQGHMAPADDMKRSQKVQDDCFLLSNIAPQVGIGFNQQIWQQLERAVQGWVEQRGALTIIVGPIFAGEGNSVRYQVIGRNRVAVPTHFFKIVVDAKSKTQVDALAFLMPNKDLRGHEISEYLVSIDDIQKLTGLDFLSALPKEVQDRLEATKASRIW